MTLYSECLPKKAGHLNPNFPDQMLSFPKLYKKSETLKFGKDDKSLNPIEHSLLSRKYSSIVPLIRGYSGSKGIYPMTSTSLAKIFETH